MAAPRNPCRCVQDVAVRATRAVHVQYGPPDQPGVFSIEQARERSSFYTLPVGAPRRPNPGARGGALAVLRAWGGRGAQGAGGGAGRQEWGLQRGTRTGWRPAVCCACRRPRARPRGHCARLITPLGMPGHGGAARCGPAGRPAASATASCPTTPAIWGNVLETTSAAAPHPGRAPWAAWRSGRGTWRAPSPAPSGGCWAALCGCRAPTTCTWSPRQAAPAYAQWAASSGPTCSNPWRCANLSRCKKQHPRWLCRPCPPALQNALAIPDEGGCIKVHTASQFIDAVQKAVAHALGVRQHSVEVRPARLLAPASLLGSPRNTRSRAWLVVPGCAVHAERVQRAQISAVMLPGREPSNLAGCVLRPPAAGRLPARGRRLWRQGHAQPAGGGCRRSGGRQDWQAGAAGAGQVGGCRWGAAWH